MRGTIDHNELAHCLIKSVQDAFKNRNLNTMTWGDMTHSLFSKLDCLANDLKVEVRHKPKDRGDRNWEFLYDVCFFVTSGKDPDGYFTPQASIKQVRLVLECEWNSYSKDRLYDFSKLLIAIAELRAFVLYENSDKRFESILQDMKSLIKDFESGTESHRYLICRITSQFNQFRFVMLDGNGQCQHDF